MKILEKDVDFVTVGRAGILHHDFPRRVMADERFEPIELPVSKEHLTQEGLSETFIKYMQRWQGDDWTQEHTTVPHPPRCR